MDGNGEGRRGFWRFWPLRFLLFFIVLLALYAGCEIAAGLLIKSRPAVPRDLFLLAGALATVAVTIPAYRLLVRWTEKRSATELGARRFLPLLTGGVLIGVVLFCGVYAVLFALHAASFKGYGSTQGLGIALAISIASAVAEEIIFRGVVYRLVEEGFGTLAALILSGALFGAIHMANPGATWASGTAIALEAGILLGAAYAATRSLWLPIGLHFGWNFTEGGIFGAAISGGQMKGLLNAPLQGPAALTGGTFGPEAGWPAVAVCLAAALVLLAIAARRGEWKGLRFRISASGA